MKNTRRCLKLYTHANFRGFEELFYILDGELEFSVGDEVIYAATGDQITIPADVPHTYGNKSGKSARLLIIHTDARMAKYFEEVEELIKQGVPAHQAVVQPTQNITQKLLSNLALKTVGSFCPGFIHDPFSFSGW